jgi:hypothetical protein
MMNGIPMAALPDGEGVAKFFSATLRREVTASAVKPTPDANLIVGGHFVNGSKILIGGCFADKALAAYAGAAFSLIPADVAKESLKAPELDEISLENFAEILNICSGVFQGGSDKRVTLTTIEYPGKPRSEASMKMLKNPVKRLDLELDIDGYGKGRITFALLPA